MKWLKLRAARFRSLAVARAHCGRLLRFRKAEPPNTRTRAGWEPGSWLATLMVTRDTILIALVLCPLVRILMALVEMIASGACLISGKGWARRIDAQASRASSLTLNRVTNFARSRCLDFARAAIVSRLYGLRTASGFGTQRLVHAEEQNPQKL
jgi:hypothetical protein